MLWLIAIVPLVAGVMFALWMTGYLRITSAGLHRIESTFFVIAACLAFAYFLVLALELAFDLQMSFKIPGLLLMGCILSAFIGFAATIWAGNKRQER